MTDAGVAYVQLLPSMRGFSAAVSKEMGSGLEGPSEKAGTKSGKSFMAGFSQSLTKGGKAMSGLGDKLTLGLTVPLALAANKATDLASDTNESLSKVQTVFGDASASVEAFAATSATAFGLSRRSALDAAGTFGNAFTQMGIGEGVAADMSVTMSGLASDFASFHNADITQVLDAQAAAFRGEFDALQRFVPMINAATVEQRALADTGKESSKELTQQEKALATYALMMEGAGAAAGDFARTQDGLANQERIAAAEAENAAAVFGQNLIPIKQQLIGVANQLIGAFNNLTPAQQEMIVKAGVVAAALGPVLSITGRLVTGLGHGLKAMRLFGKGLVGLGKGGARLAQFAGRGAAALGRLALAAGRAGLAVVRAGAQMIAAAVKATARVVASIATQIARWVVLGVQALLHAAKVALAWIISLGPLGILIAAVIAAVALIIANWDKVSAFIVGAATWVWEKVVAIWNAIVEAVGAAFEAIVAFFASIPERVVEFIVWYLTKYVEIMTAIIEFVAEALTAVVEFFAGVPDRIAEFIDWILTKHVEVFDAVVSWVSDAIDSVVEFFAGLPGRVGSALSGIAETITAPFTTAFTGIRDLWNSTVGGFGFSVPDWIPGVGGRSFNIPRMHTGGIFQAVGGASEGPAILRSGEGVFTRDQMRALGGGAGATAPNATVEFLLGAGDRDLIRWLRRQVRVKGGVKTVGALEA